MNKNQVEKYKERRDQLYQQNKPSENKYKFIDRRFKIKLNHLKKTEYIIYNYKTNQIT